MDKEGNFQFGKLTKDQEYVFRLDETDTKINVVLLDADGNIVDKDRAVEGAWQFGKIKHDRYNMGRVAIDNSEIIVSSFAEDVKPKVTVIPRK